MRARASEIEFVRVHIEMRAIIRFGSDDGTRRSKHVKNGNWGGFTGTNAKKLVWKAAYN